MNAKKKRTFEVPPTLQQFSIKMFEIAATDNVTFVDLKIAFDKANIPALFKEKEFVFTLPSSSSGGHSSSTNASSPLASASRQPTAVNIGTWSHADAHSASFAPRDDRSQSADAQRTPMRSNAPPALPVPTPEVHTEVDRALAAFESGVEGKAELNELWPHSIEPVINAEVDVRGRKFTDCVEMCLLRLLQLLLAKDTSSTNGPLRVRDDVASCALRGHGQRVAAYFKRYPVVFTPKVYEVGEGFDARVAWVELLSGHREFVYVDAAQQCELKAMLRNVLSAFKQLFGFPILMGNHASQDFLVTETMNAAQQELDKICGVFDTSRRQVRANLGVAKRNVRGNAFGLVTTLEVLVNGQPYWELLLTETIKQDERVTGHAELKTALQ
eukprot:TRINITY_DN10197_c0_g1_i1.p1 TRINITY_DN10197_c0_g1~~TRINITY_DN10197_c0_g1_i1.p1  ORF type:complete len:385 (+),score=90.09 TRINITY_DN10197_c0_g1_i1:65-1219(+)